jgi:ADP-dependent NAD(P)H-hydrate dehydratase
VPEPRRVTSSLLRGWPLPSPGSDKKARGSVLVVGGSRETPGAVLLAGDAALRVGAGKLQVGTAGSVAPHVAPLVPEARVVGLAESPGGEIVPDARDRVLELAESADVVLLGTGLLRPEPAADLLEAVLPELDRPVVVDALGSAYLTRRPDGVRHLHGRCVLTLNRSEVLHTLGDEGPGQDADAVDDVDDVAVTVRLAERVGAVVLCGGSRKVVATPEGDVVHLVEEGDAGLGISGSGDVQAGLVAGLLARGATPDQAAVWGAFLHGAGGQRLAESVGRIGFLAREISGVVPALVQSLGGA